MSSSRHTTGRSDGRRRPPSRRGFSLAELLVTAGVTLMLGMILLRTYSVSYQSYVVGSSRTFLQQKLRTAMLRLSPLIRGAVPPDPTSDVIVSPGVGLTSSELILTVPSLYFDEPFDARAPSYTKARIWFADRRIYLSRYPAASDLRVVAEGIESVRFTVKSVSMIVVNMQAKEARRDADGRERDYRATLTSIVQIPYHVLTK